MKAPLPRPPLRVAPAVDDPGAVLRLVEERAPYWPVQRYFASGAEYAALSGARPSAAMPVAPVFRGNWAVGGVPEPGIEPLLRHPRFERRGQDLYSRISVPVTLAVLGGEVSVPTLGGSAVRLRVPELTAPGRVFRLRSHGMPTVGKSDERGDLYATLDVQIPATLTEEQRRHWEALKALERMSS